MSVVDPYWPSALPPVSLSEDEVHIWCASLRRQPDQLARLTSILSESERERVRRFHSPVARNEFLVARSLLRLLLSHYIGQEPTDITFHIGMQGKPTLACGSPLHFNVAHSHGLALFAVSGLCEVGVDVEQVRPFANDLGLAERYFSESEAEVLRGMEPERRREAFFHTWARKEAVLKANGSGLALGLEGVEVSVMPDEPARLLRVDGEESYARQWTLTTLTPALDYVGAVALKGKAVRLTCWHWPE